MGVILSGFPAGQALLQAPSTPDIQETKKSLLILEEVWYDQHGG